MGNMELMQYVVGPVQTNCYMVRNTKTKEMVIIDPGASPKKLAEKAKEEGYQPKAILLTHGHFDHASGAQELSELLDVPVYAFEEEKEVLEDPEKNASWMIGKSLTFSADVYLRDEQEIDLAGFHIRVLHTPGHTKGGCCYYFSYEKTVFAGDTLFAQSTGRTDLPTGSQAEIVRSIREKLMILPDDTEVYPGHGEMTTIGTERRYNPYI